MELLKSIENLEDKVTSLLDSPENWLNLQNTIHNHYKSLAEKFS